MKVVDDHEEAPELEPEQFDDLPDRFTRIVHVSPGLHQEHAFFSDRPRTRPVVARAPAYPDLQETREGVDDLKTDIVSRSVVLRTGIAETNQSAHGQYC